MKKITIIISCLLCSFAAYSQKSSFNKGYFIRNNDTKVECLIKNEDWDYNPTVLHYKMSEIGDEKVLSMIEFKEFSVDEYKFKKNNVKIDKTNDDFDKASAVKTPDYVNDELLLRVLIEGDASLFSYASANFTRYFYCVKNAVITPLSYKVYYDENEKGYRKNETYKQEILNNLKCEKITQADIERLEYNKTRLTDIFMRFNLCSGSTITEYKEKMNYKTFELYAKAGLGMSSLSYNDGNDVDFDKKIKLKFGLEVEINLSNRIKRWSVLIEPCYQHYTNSYKFIASTADVDYKSIDFSVGLRRYLFLNSRSNLFVNAYYTYGLTLNSKIDLSNTQNDLNISKTINPTLGLGYAYNKKYTIELRYEFDRELFSNTYVDSKFSTIGLNFGYKLL